MLQTIRLSGRGLPTEQFDNVCNRLRVLGMAGDLLSIHIWVPDQKTRRFNLYGPQFLPDRYQVLCALRNGIKTCYISAQGYVQ